MGICSGKHDSKKAVMDIPFKIGPDLFVNLKGVKLDENYKIERTLGQGSFGEVLLVTHKSTDSLRAMKRISKKNIKQTEQERNGMYNEVQILKYFDHPNIVKLYELFEDTNYLYIITEHLSGGELFSRMFNKQNKNKFTEQKLASIMKSILEGLAHSHAKQIIHRDLKPANILFETEEPDAEVKLIDFGLAFKLQPDGDSPYDMQGTLLYMSPEVATGTTCYDSKCDLWSCGVMQTKLMQMLTARVPYSGSNISETRFMDEMRALNQTRLNQTIMEFGISQEAKQLMKQLLTINPERRIDAQQALTHPWIAKNSINRPLDKAVIDNLCSFHLQNNLTGAIKQLIATQMLHKKETKQLKEQFKIIDTNQDGEIGKEELRKAYLELYKDDEFKANHKTEYIFRTADLNHSGTLNYSEFLTAASEQAKLLSQDRVEKAFKIFDQDGNGYITIQELKQVMAGAVIVNQQLKDLINDFDHDHDGKISHKEFTEALLKQQNENNQ